MAGLLTGRSKQAGATLKGWDFIQEKILSHDEDMIGDFTDDIDTLLVFVSVWSRFTSPSIERRTKGRPVLRGAHRVRTPSDM